MNDKAFFDTNVLVYAFREHDHRSEIARNLLARGGVIGVQVLNEFAAVMRRKINMSWRDIHEGLAAIRVLCPPPAPVSIGTHETALGIAERYEYRVFDVLYSEDMHDGQVIEGLIIRNPFAQYYGSGPK